MSARGEIDAEQKAIAGLHRLLNPLKNGDCRGGVEVADAGADPEEELAGAFLAGAAVFGPLGGVVGDEGPGFDQGKFALDAAACGFEGGFGDVDRMILDRALMGDGGAEEGAGLVGGARAELD